MSDTAQAETVEVSNPRPHHSVWRAKLIKFGQEQGLTYPLLVGDDAVSRKYGGVEFLPTSYFVGRDGKIVAETAGLVSKSEVEDSIKKALATGGK